MSEAWFSPRVALRLCLVNAMRSASRRRGVAPEQANAPDPHQRALISNDACGRVIGGVRFLNEV
jgi:hypothetical protein